MNVMPKFLVPRALLLLAALVVLAGCGGTQKFYRLSADGASPVGTGGPGIGVGPVTLPGYLDRAELVFQSSTNEYQIPTTARWTGSLKDNISSVLATDLGERLHSGSIVSFPWDQKAKLRYQVAVDIAQFQAVSGQGAVLNVTWRVLDGTGTNVLSRHNASFQEPISGDGYDPVVAAESRLLGRLADAMASSLSHR